MSKPFKTIREQIELLHKRGLIISDYKYAKKYLLTNNYYSIINGYSKYFINSNYNYLTGTNFSEITYAYFYDKEIKYTFLKSILAAEKHIKSILAYVFSETHSETAYFYLDAKHYDTKRHRKDVSFVVRRMVNLIDKYKFSKSPNSIRHYFDSHDAVPFWVIVDYMTFGEIVAILRSVPISLQDKIAQKCYSFISEHITIEGNFTPAILLSFVENIAEVRNICAHDNRLYGFKCRNSMKYYKDLHDSYQITNQMSKSSPYHVFIGVQCFLSAKEYASLHNTLLARVRSFAKQLHTVSVGLFLDELGFPSNWHQSEKL